MTDINLPSDHGSLLRAARGLEPADLVLKGGLVVNVFTGETEAADLAVKDGLIVGLGRYDGLTVRDVSGLYLAPGLIETHLHLESALVAPGELAGILVPRGTTALVADPHEIANVLGLRGIRFLLDASAGLPLDFFFMAPSCVPATHLETSGAELEAEDLRTLLAEPRILGLAEVMNFPGVINGLPRVWDKLALFARRPIDGHSPGLNGPDLNAYLLPGIATEHETTTLAEGREKLARGLRLFIREGSQARNLADLLPLVNDHNYRRLSFCTDDRHLDDLLGEGHLDHVLRKAVRHGLPAMKAVTMATLNAAEAFGLRRRGALAPGWRADVVVFESLESFQVREVYKDGRLAARRGALTVPAPRIEPPDWISPMNVAVLDRAALDLPAAGARVRVIEAADAQVVTGHSILETPARNGRLVADPDRDLARLLVVERHRGTARVGQGLVRGFGFNQGAMASSVAHDSHNIVAAGMSLDEIILAVDTVRRLRGGLAVVAGERVLASLALPLAGLMSPAPAAEVAAGLARLEAAAVEIGCRLKAPFMCLSFLALPVIPRLKLTDRGLVDVDKFEFVRLFVE
ncbi:MAG: adenine deaminase [Thermodesulfobacteriota bacterium]